MPNFDDKTNCFWTVFYEKQLFCVAYSAVFATFGGKNVADIVSNNYLSHL